jgi:hypothetical protein
MVNFRRYTLIERRGEVRVFLRVVVHFGVVVDHVLVTDEAL